MHEHAACAALSEAERAELARIGRCRTVASGETLFAAGEPSPICAMLVSGAFKITSFGDDGSERILSLVPPFGFVGNCSHRSAITLSWR